MCRSADRTIVLGCGLLGSLVAVYPGGRLQGAGHGPHQRYCEKSNALTITKYSLTPVFNDIDAQTISVRYAHRPNGQLGSRVPPSLILPDTEYNSVACTHSRHAYVKLADKTITNDVLQQPSLLLLLAGVVDGNPQHVLIIL
jgi:hypothetical protein